jgi:hypothetical protein
MKSSYKPGYVAWGELPIRFGRIAAIKNRIGK